MLDTVLFEFDGVLVDTVEARRDALVAALVGEGIHVSADEYHEHCAGYAFDEAATAVLHARGVVFDDTLVALITARAERAFRAYVGKGVTLVDGIRDMIDRLPPVARLGIVSRTSRQEIALVLSLARLEHAFTCVIGAEDAFPPKPSASPYQTAIARLAKHRPPRARALTLAIEDSWQGIRSARSAGLRCVAVGPLPAHVAMEADAFVPDLRGMTAESLEALVIGSQERIP